MAAVRLARCGRRVVPENLDMTTSSLFWVLLLVFGLVWVRSGNGVNERCRVERHARRRFSQMKEARSSQLTGSDLIGLGTRRRRTQVLCQLSYVLTDDGTRTRNHLVVQTKEPLPA